MPPPLRLLAVTVLATSLLSSTIGVRVLEGTNPNTVCTTNELNWYTDVVGETPCLTYQRLRQICNSDYQAEGLNYQAYEGNQCKDAVSACCCNSISFALSMLCYNCVSAQPGVSFASFYKFYLAGCGPVFNRTLPEEVQTAVCNNAIKIEDDLYSMFWPNGSWYYQYTRETMEETFAATNNNSFTHCASTSVNTTQSGSSSSSTTTTASTDTPTQTRVLPTTAVTAHKLNVWPIVCGVLGGVLGTAVIGLLYLVRKPRHNSGKGTCSTPFHDARHLTSSTEVGSAAMPGLRSATGSPIADSSFAYSQQVVYSPACGVEDNRRHGDDVPLASSQRSNSGSLPPEYQSQWSGYAVRELAPSEATQEGSLPAYRSRGSGSAVGDSAPTEEVGGSGSRMRGIWGLVSRSGPQYAANVKRPLSEPPSWGWR